MRTFKATPPDRPPAIWAAFAAQAAWKNWVMAGQIVVIVLLVLVALRLGTREPDVVVIAPDGKSTYLNRSVAGDALLGFLAEQRHRPSDLTVAHFTRDFLQLALAMNSSTVDATWAQALSFMAPGLRSRVSADAESKKLIEATKLARIRTELAIEDLVLAERTDALLHVRANVTRKRTSLLDDGSLPVVEDRLAVELVERIVPRSPARPDGLELAEWRIAPGTPLGHTKTMERTDAR